MLDDIRRPPRRKADFGGPPSARFIVAALRLLVEPLMSLFFLPGLGGGLVRGRAGACFVPFGHIHQSAGFMLTKRFCRSGLCVRDENPPSGAERGVRRGVEPPKRTQRGSNGQFLGSHDGGSGRKNNRPLPGSAVAWPRCQIKGGVLKIQHGPYMCLF